MTRTRHYIEYWIISFFLLIPFSAFSEDAEVKGTLFDAALKIPVEMATVRLSHLPDSTFISGTASDKDGLFKLVRARSRKIFYSYYLFGISVCL